MPDYSKSIIYTIRSRDSVYVGSTIDFRSRKYQHKCAIHNENSISYNLKLYKTIRENDGEWDMQPYSKYPCKDKFELTIEEERIRQLLKADMNSKSCGTGCSRNEYSKQYYKQYYEKNKDRYLKQYYEPNKDELNKKMKQYYEQNKDKISEKKKQYYQLNKDELNKKITCECGCIVTKRSLTQHHKSKKHINFMEKLND